MPRSCPGASMKMKQPVATLLARHEALSVTDFRCTSRVSSTHSEPSLSYVTSGSLRYRACGKAHDLVAGAILIGRLGVDYVCTHERGDGGGACLSFRLGPALAELISDGSVHDVDSVPPTAELMVLGELAQSAIGGKADVGRHEMGFLLVARLRERLSDRATHVARGTATDRRRAIDAAAWIDVHSHEEIDLDRVARIAGIGPFHFLRTFSKVLGVTPHQYLVRCRLQRAARLLAEEPLSISDIALDVGFGDLSNFVRTFRRASGLSPQQFRRAARGDATLLTQGL